MKKKTSFLDIQIKSTKGNWNFNPATIIIKDKKKLKKEKEIAKDRMSE